MGIYSFKTVEHHELNEQGECIDFGDEEIMKKV